MRRAITYARSALPFLLALACSGAGAALIVWTCTK